MPDDAKTREDLLQELVALRRRITALEAAEGNRSQEEDARHKPEPDFLITAHTQAEDELTRRRREAEILAELARTLNTSLDLDTVLQHVAEGAKVVCGSDVASLALRESQSEAMVLRYWDGCQASEAEQLRVESGKGLGGQVLLTGQPCRTDQYAADPRFSHDYVEVVRRRGTVAVMAVPIRIGARIEGVLFVANRTPRPFTARDEAILLRLADHAAIAIRNAQLFARERAAHTQAQIAGQRFRDLVESLDAIVWEAVPPVAAGVPTAAPQRRFSFVSQGTQALLGYTVERWLTEPAFWSHLIHPDDHDRTLAACRMHVAIHTDFALEYRVVAADGRVVWLRDLVHVVRDRDGQPRQLRGVMVDITERTRAEEMLRKLSSAVEQTADAVFITDREGIIEYLNPAFEALTGYTQAEAMGQTPRILKSGWHDASFYQDVWQTLLAGGVFRAVFSNKKKSGEVYDEEKTITPLKDSHGTITHFVSTGRDITARRQAEAESERRRRAAEGLAEVGRLISQSLDPQEVGQRITDTMLALFGAHGVALYWLEPASGDLVGLAVSGSMSPLFRRRRALRGGMGVVDHVVRERRPVATPNVLADPRFMYSPEIRAWIEQADFRAILAVPLLVEDRVIGVLGLRDHEGRSFDAEEIRLARAFADQAATALENARLYHETQQAYHQLMQTQEQLIQAQKMEAVGRLAAGVAHDFNNLLTVIIGRAQLLLMRLRPEEPLRQDLELIQETAHRAASLTHQLLAFSRKQILQPKLLNLNGLVTDAAQMLRRLIGEDIELLTVFDAALGQVRADPSQLEQVVLNLVVNARDAMPRGGRLILETANVTLDDAYAREHPGVQPGPYVRLAVRDTGIGMDAETRTHLFEPFFTTKGPGKGTGLGLAIAYGIVTQSGGQIVVDSTPEQGTTFTMYLPRVEECPEALEPQAVGLGLARGLETILLAEDDDGVREMVREMLQLAGYTVLPAANGGEALRLGRAQQGPIHLLLTDVVMPGMSGRELADRLADVRPDMKVLFASGYTDEALGQHGVLDPAVTLLQKPFTPDALGRKVREVLDAGPTR